MREIFFELINQFLLKKIIVNIIVDVESTTNIHIAIRSI